MQPTHRMWEVIHVVESERTTRVNTRGAPRCCRTLAACGCVPDTGMVQQRNWSPYAMWRVAVDRNVSRKHLHKKKKRRMLSRTKYATLQECSGADATINHGPIHTKPNQCPLRPPTCRYTSKYEYYLRICIFYKCFVSIVLSLSAHETVAPAYRMLTRQQKKRRTVPTQRGKRRALPRKPRRLRKLRRSIEPGAGVTTRGQQLAADV